MNKNTLLLRQVHPSWVQGDTISSQTFSSQTFKPTPKDKGLLSAYNQEKFAPEAAFIHHTEQGLASVGIVAVSNEECQQESLPVMEDNTPFDGHCSIDYRELSGNQVEKKAKKLKAKAQTRGWLFRK